MIRFATAFAIVALGGCSSGPRSDATPPVAVADTGPVALGRAGSGEGGTTVLTGAPDARELTLALERARVTLKRPGGTPTIAGADLNADGTVEALVLMSGEGWCVRGGCTLLVMQKSAYGYRIVSEVRGAAGPVAISPTGAAGWRHLIVGGPRGPAQVPFAASGYAAQPGEPADFAAAQIVIPADTALAQGAPLQPSPRNP